MQSDEQRSDMQGLPLTYVKDQINQKHLGIYINLRNIYQLFFFLQD